MSEPRIGAWYLLLGTVLRRGEDGWYDLAGRRMYEDPDYPPTLAPWQADLDAAAEREAGLRAQRDAAQAELAEVKEVLAQTRERLCLIKTRANALAGAVEADLKHDGGWHDRVHEALAEWRKEGR